MNIGIWSHIRYIRLRGGVWIKTITFLSNNSESNSIRDTYPISISSKRISHDVVEKQYLDELNDLYHGEIIDSILINYTNS